MANIFKPTDYPDVLVPVNGTNRYIRSIKSGSTTLWIKKWNLAVNAGTGGSITITGGEPGEVVDGKSLSLIATPSSGYKFDRWEFSKSLPQKYKNNDSSATEKSTITPNGNKLNLTVKEDVTVSAVFSLNTVELTIYRFANDASPLIKQVNIGTTVNVANEVSLVGWTLIDLHSISGSAPTVNTLTVKVEEDTAISCTWIKTYHNLLMETAKDNPSRNLATGEDDEFRKLENSIWTIFALDKSNNLALPTGARIALRNLIGLCQHSGGSISHHLSFAPVYTANYSISEDESVSDFVKQGLRETADGGGTKAVTSKYVRKVNDTRGYIPGVVSVAYSSQQRKINNDESLDQDTWGNLRPRSNYGTFDWTTPNYETSGPTFGGSGTDTWRRQLVLKDREPATGSTLWRWTGYHSNVESASEEGFDTKHYGNKPCIINHCAIGVTSNIDDESITDVSGGNDWHMIEISYTDVDTSSEINVVPATINGTAPDLLTFAIIKRSKGCTVYWYLLIYTLELILY